MQTVQEKQGEVGVMGVLHCEQWREASEGDAEEDEEEVEEEDVGDGEIWVDDVLF